MGVDILVGLVLGEAEIDEGGVGLGHCQKREPLVRSGHDSGNVRRELHIALYSNKLVHDTGPRTTWRRGVTGRILSGDLGKRGCPCLSTRVKDCSFAEGE